MKLLRIVSLCAIVLFAGCVREAPERRATGAPQRIVSLAPSVTETLFALGAGDEVVGVSQYCDYPPAVKSLPRVGSFITPNIEAIMALRPTLVIGLATSSNLPEIRALTAMRISTLMADDGEGRSIAAIERSIIVIGDRIGRNAAAHALVQKINAHLQAIAARTDRRPRRSVLMVVGHQPMVAVGRGTFLDQLMALAGGANIAPQAEQAWPRLSVEYIIACRPDIILDGQMGTDPADQGIFWSKYPTIPAVKNHRVYGYPESPTLHPGPRIGLTLDLMARLIHPELFRSRAAQ